MKNAELNKKRCGSNANTEVTGDATASVCENINEGAKAANEAKFTIPEFMQELQGFLENDLLSSKRQCPLKAILDQHDVAYVVDEKEYLMPLCTGYALRVDPKTGNYTYGSGRVCYRQKQLSPQGWADFLCRHKLVPLDYASQEEREKIQNADRWFESIKIHVESMGWRHNVDEVSRHIFVNPHGNCRIRINCFKQFITSSSIDFDFEDEEYKDIIQLLVDDAG